MEESTSVKDTRTEKGKNSDVIQIDPVLDPLEGCSYTHGVIWAWSVMQDVNAEMIVNRWNICFFTAGNIIWKNYA